MHNFLFVVEGEVAENRVIESIYLRLGFNVLFVLDSTELRTKKFSNNQKNIFVIQGPKNRLKDLLTVDGYTYDIPQFYKIKEWISKCFVIFDADYNSEKQLREIFQRLNDENEGLLLISNPCLEVLADDQYDVHVGRSKEYKKKLRKQIETKYPSLIKSKSLYQYIDDNIKELLLNQMQRNLTLFNEKDITIHPELAINLVAKTNTQDFNTEKHKFEYLLTVLYVSIGHVFDLVRDFDNFDLVYQFISDNL